MVRSTPGRIVIFPLALPIHEGTGFLVLAGLAAVALGAGFLDFVSVLMAVKCAAAAGFGENATGSPGGTGRRLKHAVRGGPTSLGGGELRRPWIGDRLDAGEITAQPPGHAWCAWPRR